MLRLLQGTIGTLNRADMIYYGPTLPLLSIGFRRLLANLDHDMLARSA